MQNNWWTPSGKGNLSHTRGQEPPNWLIADGRDQLISSTAFGLSERCMQNIKQEVARCKSLLSAPPVPSLSEPIWLAQGFNPRTRQSLPPLLNDEGAITGGTSFRSSLTRPGSIFQVNNTFTRIESGGHTNQGYATPKMVKANSASVDTARSRTIPLYPECLRAVLRHWVFDSPNEGCHKALVKFSKKERNAKLEGETSSTIKKVYSKRKTISIAFLLFSDRNGVDAYEREFCSLSETFLGTQLLTRSAEYLREEKRKDHDFRKWIQTDTKIIEFTQRVSKKLDLKKLLFKK